MPNHRLTSAYLTDGQGRHLIEAFGFAEQIGLPLNTHVIGHLADRYKHLTPQDCTRLLTKNLSDFARHNSYESAWISVFEVGPVHDTHVHLLVHIPDGLAKKGSTALKRWGKGLTPAYKARGDITLKTKRRRKNTPRFTTPNGTTYVETHYNGKNLLIYLLKGLAPDSELARRITDTSTAKRGNWKPTFQGSIEGQRCRVSDNIGRTARARFDNEVILFP